LNAEKGILPHARAFVEFLFILDYMNPVFAPLRNRA